MSNQRSLEILVFEISQIIPSPFDGGGCGRGWTKKNWIPLLSISSHEGRRDFSEHV